MRSMLAFFSLIAMLGIMPQPAAAANSFVGTWQGTVMVHGLPFTSRIVLQSNGQYSDLDRSGSLMTQEVGTWKIAQGLLALTVVNWAPKQQCLPNTGCVPIRKPPGSLYRVQWLSANVIRCQDVNFGGIITYQRR